MREGTNERTYTTVKHITTLLQHSRVKNILFCEFLTQLDPISQSPIAILLAAVEINYKDTLKFSRKIMKITDPNLGFFLAMGRIGG